MSPEQAKANLAYIIQAANVLPELVPLRSTSNKTGGRT